MTLNGLEYENLLSLFKFAHNNNITTSFDVTYDPTGIWFGRICDALPYTDYLFASFEEAGLSIYPFLNAKISDLRIPLHSRFIQSIQRNIP